MDSVGTEPLLIAQMISKLKYISRNHFLRLWSYTFLLSAELYPPCRGQYSDFSHLQTVVVF